MRQFNRERVYRNTLTGKQSTRIMDLLDRDVTVRKNYVVPRNESGNRHTLFKNIEIVPALETLSPEAKALLTRKAGTSPWSTQTYLSTLKKALVKFVSESWSQDKFHLIFHSSGYDSRVMSWAIRQGTTESQRTNVLFACFGAEAETAKQILLYEGWPEDQFVGITDFDGYYERLLTFSGAWRMINGAALGIFNLNYGLSWLLEDLGLIPSDENAIQQWSGFGSDYLLAGANNRAGNFLQQQFLRVRNTPISMSFFKAREVAYPYFSLDVLRMAIVSAARLGYRYRMPLLRTIDKKLAAFPRVDAKLPPIPPSLMESCVVEYGKSWYGKNVRLGAADQSDQIGSYNPWWSYWTAAAFCEHLLQEGYRLSVQ
jgi:hypothetical protein